MLYIVLYLDLNGKSRGEEKGGGLRSLAGCTQRGGGHSDAYSVQQGGGGGSKIREKMRT